MQDKKTKSIKNIENKMEEIDGGSLRYRVLENAKNFKTSWIDLGQTLFSVWKDKLYKEWGYSEFELYTAKEIGIKKETALKLLRSYTFLEKEEPRLINKERAHEVDAREIPSYEAVDVLRQASNKDIDGETYKKIRKYVLEDGKDAKFIKKDLADMIKKKAEEEDPQAAKDKKKLMVLRRLIGTLRVARTEIKYGNLLSEETLKKIDDIVKMLEAKLEKETADE